MRVTLGEQTFRDVGLHHLALVLNCSVPNSQPWVSLICIRNCVDMIKFHRNSGCFFGSQLARAEYEIQAGTSTYRLKREELLTFPQVRLPDASLKSLCLGGQQVPKKVAEVMEERSGRWGRSQRYIIAFSPYK